jgi:carboxyl-terminal processing protease
MKKAFVIGSLLVVLTLSLGGSAVSKVTDNAATYEQLRLFTEVLSIVQNQYVDEVPPKDLIYSAIKGTLRGLPASLPGPCFGTPPAESRGG